MAQYINVGGVARRVTKRHENIGGVARSILKAYENVNGAARQYFSGGVKWHKWSCEESFSSTRYEEDLDNVNIGMTHTANYSRDSNRDVCSDYTFTEDDGYVGIGEENLMVADWAGYYNVSSTRVLYYESVEDVGDNDTYAVTYTYVGYATHYGHYSYDKGDTDYGIVYAPEGELPEDGELERGSATGSYCVVNVNGTYYYYEKVTE